MYTCVRVLVCLCTQACMFKYICMSAWMHVLRHTCTYVCMYACLYACVLTIPPARTMSAGTSIAGSAPSPNTRTSCHCGVALVHLAQRAWRGRRPTRMSRRLGGGPCRTAPCFRPRRGCTSTMGGSCCERVGLAWSILSSVQCPESRFQTTAKLHG